jgi:hypothetical protein
VLVGAGEDARVGVGATAVALMLGAGGALLAAIGAMLAVGAVGKGGALGLAVASPERIAGATSLGSS